MQTSFTPNNGNVPPAAIVCLKVILIFFPFAWFLGFFPPIDAFFLWLFEQCYIYIYGGTATATSMRLIVQLTTAVILSVIANYIPSDIAIVALLASFGYILSSIDFLFIVEWLHHLRVSSRVGPAKKSKSNKESNASSINDDPSSSTSPVVNQNSEQSGQTARNSREFPLNWKDWLFHLVMFVLNFAVALVIICVFNQVFTTTQTPFLIETILLYVCLATFVLCKICGDFQSVYWFFGLVRNPFYPKEAISAEVRSKKPKRNTSDKQHSVNGNRVLFKLLRYLRIILLRICAPLILCAVIAIDCHLNKVYNDKLLGFWRILIVLRAFRWVSLKFSI